MSSTNPFPPGPGGFPGVPGAMPPTGPVPPAAPPKGRRGKKHDDDTKPVTRRVISRQAKLAGIFAVLVALLVGVVLFGSTAPTKFVAVAATDIAPLSQLAETQVQVVPADDALLVDGALTGASEDEVRALVAPLIGTQVLLPVRKGAQLNAADFSAAAAVGVTLAPDERLIAVRATLAAAAGGNVRTGDRVDVYGANVASSPLLVGLLVPDVEVVAVGPAEEILNSATQQQATGENRDKEGSELLPTKPLGGTYVLKVNLADVSRLLAVDASGRVYLSLRGTDAAGGPTVPIDVLAAICGAGANPDYGIDARGVAACTPVDGPVAADTPIE